MPTRANISRDFEPRPRSAFMLASASFARFTASAVLCSARAWDLPQPLNQTRRIQSPTAQLLHVRVELIDERGDWQTCAVAFGFV